MNTLRRLSLLWLYSTLLVAADATHADVPRPLEPEEDNSEYLLDLVSNDYSPAWLRMWEGGDNRLRFRLGSNSVEQWFIEEELKLATSLVDDRLRFRYRHARLHRHAGERIGADTFEFETRVAGRAYVSAFLTPSSVKADNAVGVAVQHRRRVDRFTLFFLEFPHVARNVIEREKDNSDEFIAVFDERPVRFGLRMREEPIEGLLVRLDWELVPRFEIVEQVQRSGAVVRRESGSASSLAGNLEYDRGRREDDGATIGGVAFGYRLADRDDTEPQRPGLALAAKEAGPSPLIALEFDSDLYSLGALDSLSRWETKRAWAKPYLWFEVNDRWTLRCALHLEEREIERVEGDGATTTITNRYTAARAGARFALGARRRSSVELGWASSLRRREELTATMRERHDIHENRVYLAYEISLGEARAIRAIESFDLDREDRGKFWIHDHAFVQLIFGF